MSPRGIVPWLFGLVACATAPPRASAPLIVPVESTLQRRAAPAAPADASSLPLVAETASLALFVQPTHAGDAVTTPKMVDVSPMPLRKKWSVRVGKTTFRSTMAMVNGSLVIGTHGDTLDGKNESSDAVYVLEGKTGRTKQKITAPGTGDKDVGGIAISSGDVVFTTDHGYVVKARLDGGALVWSAQVAGKARPAPALADLDGKGARDVVVGDEEGVLHAFSGDDGKPLWAAPTGENDYGARGFIAAAAIADLDHDGKDDVIAGARDGVLAAYHGQDGQELWREQMDSGIHASPQVLDLDGDGRLEVLAAWSYSRIAILDAPTGVARYVQELALDQGGIEGLFASPIPLPAPSGPGFFVQPTSWWGGKRGKGGRGALVDGVVLVAQAGRAYRTSEGRVTASAIVMDLDDDGSPEAIVGTEAGDLLALRSDGHRVALAKLGGSIEATALAADVDDDGSYEIVVASNDGMLTCFATSSKTKPLVPRFRGESSENRGELGAIPLGWQVTKR